MSNNIFFALNRNKIFIFCILTFLFIVALLWKNTRPLGQIIIILMPGFIWSKIIWKKEEYDLVEKMIIGLAIDILLITCTAATYTLNHQGIHLASMLVFFLIYSIIGTFILLYHNPTFQKIISSFPHLFKSSKS
jgi:hypothetical protein